MYRSETDQSPWGHRGLWSVIYSSEIMIGTTLPVLQVLSYSIEGFGPVTDLGPEGKVESTIHRELVMDFRTVQSPGRDGCIPNGFHPE